MKNAAASASSRPSGAGSALAAFISVSSAKAPPIGAADEPVAGRDPGHPGPTATTSPHSSTPGVNGSGGRTW